MRGPRHTPPIRLSGMLQGYIGSNNLSAYLLAKEIGLQRETLMRLLEGKDAHIKPEMVGRVIAWMLSSPTIVDAEIAPPVIHVSKKIPVIVDENTIQNDKLITSEKSAPSAPEHAPGRGPRRRKSRPDKLSKRLVGTVNGKKA